MENLGRQQVLATVERIREQASKNWGGGATYNSQRRGKYRSLPWSPRVDGREGGRPRLVKKALEAGETAYTEAAYDTATVHTCPRACFH